MTISPALPSLTARASARPAIAPPQSDQFEPGATCTLADQRKIQKELSDASMAYDTMKFAYVTGAGMTVGTGMAAVGTATGQLPLVGGLVFTSALAGFAGYCMWGGHTCSKNVDEMLTEVAKFNQAHGCYTNAELEHLWQTAF